MGASLLQNGLKLWAKSAIIKVRESKLKFVNVRESNHSRCDEVHKFIGTASSL
jgi:hypothetical protein